MARGKSRGKQRHGPGRLETDEGPGEAWLVTYADAITLLMAFFMMLYAMSQVDQVKFDRLIAGFADPFGNPNGQAQTGDLGILSGGDAIVGDFLDRPGGPTITVPQDPFADTESDPIEIEFRTAPVPINAEGAEGVELNREQLRAVQDEIQAELASQGYESAATFRITERGLVVSIASDGILFQTGSTVIQAGGRDVIARIAPVLARFTNDVGIEGHTDSTPLNRGGYTNWNLSTDRAVAIVQAMIDDLGIDPVRLSAVGYGENRPVFTNATALGRAGNRRVEIIIFTSEGSEIDAAAATPDPSSTEEPDNG